MMLLTMPKTVASPRPVPLPTSLVVKNGSKMRADFLRRDAAAGVGDAQANEFAGPGLGIGARIGFVDGRGWRSE